VLPAFKWFQKPLDEFIDIEVCAESNYLATDACPAKTTSIQRKTQNYRHRRPWQRSIGQDIDGVV